MQNPPGGFNMSLSRNLAVGFVGVGGEVEPPWLGAVFLSLKVAIRDYFFSGFTVSFLKPPLCLIVTLEWTPKDHPVQLLSRRPSGGLELPTLCTAARPLNH